MMVYWVFCVILSLIYIARFITSQCECLMTCDKSSMVTICDTEVERSPFDKSAIKPTKVASFITKACRFCVLIGGELSYL
jgi:hypothetical protein